MTKGGLVEKLAEETESTKAQALKMLNSLLNIIEDALKRGEDVNIAGFGKFYVSKRSKRKGRNPATGKIITIPESRLPSFKSGASFKKAFK